MADATNTEAHDLGSADVGFRACVHRGTRQIGGTCIELACGGSRLVLDLGLPLDTGNADPASLLPDVAGLHGRDPHLLAVIVSHGHADHSGLVRYADAGVRVIAGAATRRILHAAAAFVPGAAVLPEPGDDPRDLVDRQTIRIGPFAITPFLVDHSAFDAYALLIEAGGRRLFYTADIRGHGRKGALFERLLTHPPQPVHAMLMEGSSLGRLRPDEDFPRESDIEARLVAAFRADGLVAVCASAQNIDRIVSLYRACKRTGRTLVLDLYAAEVLAATGNPNIPQAGWPNIAIYVPEYQRRQIKRTQRFDLTQRYKPHRIFRDRLANQATRAVMLFRPAMVADLDEIREVWAGARAIWSQWEGYLEYPANEAFRARLAERGVGLETIHTSGHASIIDLKRLVQALAPEVLVPVHTSAGDRFPALFGSNVRLRSDGEWWRV